ncbi:MAG TPA: S41 family peptidase [Anaeromyxobacter sp.]
MRALLPLILLLASVPAATRDTPPSSLRAACGPAAPATPDDPACAGKPLCSAPQRVKLACEMGDALARRYVFFTTKRASADAPFFSDAPPAAAPSAAAPAAASDRSLDAHLADCVGAERAIAREEDPLRFYDRLRACTAALGDGHVSLGVPSGVPTVALGIGLRRVGGKVVVASRDERLLRKLDAAPGAGHLRDALAVGNEVVGIDGRPVRDAVEELVKLVPGSSPAARLERAVDALTRRDFLFPEARAATLTLSVRGRKATVRLPWWISPDARASALGRAYADRSRLETTDLVSWAATRDRATTGAASGAIAGTLRTDPILPPRDAARLRELLDERDRVAVRIGEVVRRRDRAFCYLQVLSFHTDTLAEGGDRRPFADALDGFVRECKDKGLDLVVDLRENEGGYLANASALVAALLPRGAEAPGGALLLRATDQARAVYEERARRRQWPSDGPDPARVLPELSSARRAGRDFTDAFFEAPVRASEQVGGYDGRVVVLVAPTCMSACDRAAAMLRATGRAVLVGEPTEGAGGSQQEIPGEIGTRWQDPAGLVSLAIPNAAMGVPPDASARAAAADAGAFFRGLALENRPVQPDVPYAPRAEDVTEHGRGWLAVVDGALFPPQAAPVAAAPAAAPAPARIPAAVDTGVAPARASPVTSPPRP